MWIKPFTYTIHEDENTTVLETGCMFDTSDHDQQGSENYRRIDFSNVKGNLLAIVSFNQCRKIPVNFNPPFIHSLFACSWYVPGIVYTWGDWWKIRGYVFTKLEYWIYAVAVDSLQDWVSHYDASTEGLHFPNWLIEKLYLTVFVFLFTSPLFQSLLPDLRINLRGF